MKVNFRRMISNIVFMLKYAFKYTPLYIVNLCLYEVFASVEVFFEFTFCIKFLVDLIQYNGEFKDAVIYLTIISIIIVIKLFWAAINSFKIEPNAKEKLHKEMRNELYKKAVELDLERYDNPECYNDFVWSISEVDKRIDELIVDIGKFFSFITRIIINGVFIIALDKLGILIVLISLGITMFSNSKLGKIEFEMENELKPLKRKRNYFSRVFYLNDYAKELRLTPIGTQLQEDFKETNQKFSPIIKKYGGKQAFFGSLGEIVGNSLCLEVFYLGYLVYLTVVKKALSYGSVVPLFNASSNLKNSLRSFALLIPQFQKHSLYIEKIRTFLSFERNVKDGKHSIKTNEFESLSMHNVSFAYGNDEPTLKNISLHIKAGEKIAIVGYNGAGKTTLIKLIMRLYDVSAGRIDVNGKDIKDFILNDYRDLYGSVFQDYKLYAASLSENVKMDKVMKEDYNAIEHALDQSGFKKRLNSLDQGLDTPVTKEFNEQGINFSGGEAQKIAIARIFLKDTPIVILDEPSSAFDPISEYNFNQTMLKATENKTVIIISHRLSSARMVDRIYMLEKGSIIEEGSHDELISLNGKYAQMFQMQAEKYNLQY